MLSRLWRPSIDCESVIRMVDSPPIGKILLEGCFDLPVFDKVLDERGKACGFMVHFFGYDDSKVSAGFKQYDGK